MWCEFSGRPLSLDEVTSLGEPALFLDFGEALLYEHGCLYDLHETVSASALAYPPEELPAQILDHGAGIEYGWHHLSECACRACCERRIA